MNTTAMAPGYDAGFAPSACDVYDVEVRRRLGARVSKRHLYEEYGGTRWMLDLAPLLIEAIGMFGPDGATVGEIVEYSDLMLGGRTGDQLRRALRILVRWGLLHVCSVPGRGVVFRYTRSTQAAFSAREGRR